MHACVAPPSIVRTFNDFSGIVLIVAILVHAITVANSEYKV
jgi:hypothetical protein